MLLLFFNKIFQTYFEFLAGKLNIQYLQIASLQQRKTIKYEQTFLPQKPVLYVDKNRFFIQI